MNAKTKITTALAAIALSLTAAACGTGDSGAAATITPTPAEAGAEAEADTSIQEDRPTKALDELVAINSGRMHIRCTGSGDATVLLLAGWDEGAESWGAVEPGLTGRTRVCSYERFGTGTSEAPPTTQTFDTQAEDLHALLRAAGEPGPYVVVGHSFGGAEAVTFTSRYRDEVAGLMLIDASPTEWPTVACSVPDWQALCATFHDPSLDPERLDVIPAFDGVAAIASLGNVPMTVMPRAQYTSAGIGGADLVRLAAAWAEGAERWAALSSDSTVVPVDDAGHHIQVDQPARVVHEVTALLDRAAERISRRSGSMGL